MLFRSTALVVPDKAERVHNFHRLTLKALSGMLAAAGLEHPDDLKPYHLVRRVSPTEIRQFSELHTFLQPDELLGEDCKDGVYAGNWRRASADTFAPADE